MSRLICYAASALLASTSIAIAGPTVEELDQRMTRMESNMETILKLLQDQKKSGGTQEGTTNTMETEVPTASDLRRGALFFDVHLLPTSNDELKAMRRDPSQLPDRTSNSAVGSVPVEVPASFEWGAVLKQPSLARFSDANANLEYNWNGFLSIFDEGSYVIFTELAKKEGEGPQSCRSVLRLNNEVIGDVLYKEDNWSSISRNRPASEGVQNAVDLARGNYEFSLFLTCAGNRNDGFETIAVLLQMKGPGDRAPKPIPAEQFGIKQ